MPACVTGPLTVRVLQGYIADHRDIELLKLKNFVLGEKIADSVVFGGPGMQEKLEEIFRPMVPFVSAWDRHHVVSAVHRC